MVFLLERVSKLEGNLLTLQQTDHIKKKSHDEVKKKDEVLIDILQKDEIFSLDFLEFLEDKNEKLNEISNQKLRE